jgi:hypothetical protein
VVVPDATRPFPYPVSRGAFVKKVTNLTITSGVLTGVHIDKPSELVGATKIPLDISKQIADIPKGILSVQVSQTQQEANLVQQQTAVVQQQAALAKAKAQLIQAQADLKHAQETPNKP